MATVPSVAPVRDAPLRETTRDKTDNGVAAPARHPAWLRSLWHYDPGYDYDLEQHEYDEFRTTDPYYIDLEVRLSPLPEHSVFLDRAGRNLEAWSPVLQTRIRTHAAHGFQCRDPATGHWVEMKGHLEAKGRAEGVEIGKAEAKREALLDLARGLHPMPAEYRAFVRKLDQTPWTEWPDIATVLQRFQR